MMPGYYDLTEYVSNSDLGDLALALRAKEKPDLQKVYNFGNLVDAAITEEHKIKGNTLELEAGGETAIFEPEDMEKAQLMKEAYYSKEDLQFVFSEAKTQYIFIRKAQVVEYNGFSFTIPARCKLDLYRKNIIGGDLKTTACTSDGAFLDAISLFNYDRQAAWYMDLARLQRFMFIGIGKKPGRRGKHPVFTRLVNRGDEIYNSGLAKYSKLAFQYNFYVHNFNKIQ